LVSVDAEWPASLYWLVEASLVKLPDDSFLAIDPWFGSINQFGTNSERYIPSLNRWIRDANLPVEIYSTNDVEMGGDSCSPPGKCFSWGAPGTPSFTPHRETPIWVAGLKVLIFPMGWWLRMPRQR
jgi:hypothetical protein